MHMHECILLTEIEFYSNRYVFIVCMLPYTQLFNATTYACTLYY